MDKPATLAQDQPKKVGSLGVSDDKYKLPNGNSLFHLFIVFRFTDVGKLPPPVLQFVEVKFGYTPDNLIYKCLDFGVDLDSRVALVGPNGAGKSTLLKLMTGDLVPLDGMVKRHNHLKIGQYHQHLSEKLDLDMSALAYMMREYPGNEEEKMRSSIGRFGLTGKAQVMPMKNLSDGQKSRVIFVWLAFRQPQMLLLDEPTNHLVGAFYQTVGVYYIRKIDLIYNISS